MNKRWLVIRGLALAAVAAVWFQTRSAGRTTIEAASPTVRLVDSVMSPAAISVRQMTPDPDARRPVASALPLGPAARARADSARARIAATKAPSATANQPTTRSQPKPADDPPTMPAPVGSGNQVNQQLGQYVRDMMTEQFFPMGRACYEQFTPEGSKLRGRVVLDVTIVGDASVGGVVDEVKVSPDSTIDNEALVSCFRESMMAMMFRAPPNGTDKVDFTIPLEFAPESDAKPGKR